MQTERISLPIWKKILISIISILLFVIQILFAIILFDLYANFANRVYQSLGIAYVVIIFIALIYVVAILQKTMHPSFKVTWIVLILLFPITFCPLYTLNLLTRKYDKKRKKKSLEIENGLPDDLEKVKNIDKTAYNMISAVSHGTYAPVYSNCKFDFYDDPSLKFEQLIIDLENAKEYICMEYFIISSGFLMDKICNILQEKSNQGIKSYIIYDDVGSKTFLNKKLIKKLNKIENCYAVPFAPIGINFNLLVNYRDHRKLIIIDGKIAYTGGDNLADEYIHKKIRFGKWRDNAARFEGKIVESFINLFKQMWYSSTKTQLDIKSNIELFDNDSFIMAYGDGPLNNENSSYDLFSLLINSASKYLYISTPYLIIDDNLINLIALKAKSNVEVVLLVPHIPDKKSPFYMTRRNYEKILLAGGKIYEYTEGFNHAKNIIVDDKYGFVGSVNFDYRSLFLHYEIGCLIINDKQIINMKNDYINAINCSEQIEYDKWKKRPLYEKLIAILFNLFSTMF